MATEKVRRNQSILKDYQSNTFKVSELTAKYKVSQKRLYEIIDRELVRQSKEK